MEMTSAPGSRTAAAAGAGWNAARRRGATAHGAQPAAGMAARAGRRTSRDRPRRCCCSSRRRRRRTCCSPSGRASCRATPARCRCPAVRSRTGRVIEEAALREASEETGVDPAAVRVLGRLTPLHIPVSGFVLQPVVGVADARPEFRLAGTEVEQLLEPSLDDLLDPAAVRRFPRSARTACSRTSRTSPSTACRSGAPPRWCSRSSWRSCGRAYLAGGIPSAFSRLTTSCPWVDVAPDLST